MAIITAQAKLYTGIRCWCVDKNISAALSAAFSVGNLDIDFPVDGAVVDVNSNVNWTNPLTSTTYNKVQIYSNIYNWRLRRAVCDMRAVPSISLTDERYKTYGGGNVSITVSDNGRVVRVSQPADTQIVYVGNFIGVVPTSSNTGATPPTFDITITDVSNQGKIALTITNPGKNNAQGNTLTFDFQKFYPGSPAGTFTCTVSEITAPNTLLKTGGWTAVSTVSCTFPTYIEIDIEKLGIPEGTTCTLNFDEGWMLEDRGRRLPSGAWEYPDASQGALSPEQPNYVTFRTPWYGVGRFTSAFSLPNRTGLRIKQLASSVNSSSTISAFGVRNPGRLASLVVSLFTASASISKTMRTAVSMLSASTLVSRIGFLKFFASDVSSTFNSSIASFNSRIRPTQSAMSSIIDVVCTPYQYEGIILNVPSFAALTANVTRIEMTYNLFSTTAISTAGTRVRFAASAVQAVLSTNVIGNRVALARANITAQASLSCTATKPMVIASSGSSMNIGLFGTVDAIINWGDGTEETATTQGTYSHTYATAAEREITIRGTLTGYGAGPTNTITHGSPSVKSFGEIGLTNLDYAFKGVGFGSNSYCPQRLPLTVTSLKGLFFGASQYRSRTFNNTWLLHNWNTVNVTDMSFLFFGCINISADAPSGTRFSNWNVSNVTTLESMFQNSIPGGSVSSWNTANVVNMKNVFNSSQTSLSQFATSWNVSKVTNMEGMFFASGLYNANLSTWNVSKVTNMKNMFSYNGDGSTVNYTLDNWDVSEVTTMEGMFENTRFNGNITRWDTQAVSNMNSMFRSNNLFAQDLTGWCVSLIPTIPTNFGGNTGWTTKPGWGTCPLSLSIRPQFTLTADVWNVQYLAPSSISSAFTPALSATLDANPITFIASTGQGPNTGFTLYSPTATGTIDVDWGDGVRETFTMTTAFRNITHTYTNLARTSFSIVTLYNKSSTIAHIEMYDFNANFVALTNWGAKNNWNKLKLRDSGITFVPTAPIPTTITTAEQMFRSCRMNDVRLKYWNVSNITDMSAMFSQNGGNGYFNQDLSKWCVSSIPTKPSFFDSIDTGPNTVWTQPQPVWGTCPSMPSINRMPKNIELVAFSRNGLLTTSNSKFGSSCFNTGTNGGNAAVSPDPDFAFENRNFTIEMFVNPANFTGIKTYWDNRLDENSPNSIRIDLDGSTLKYIVNGVTLISGTYTASANTWAHIAVSRSGTSTRLFVNGVQLGSTLTDTNVYRTGIVWIGGTHRGAQFAGLIDEVRVSKSARYTANFTPATSAFTNDSNTVLLLHFEGANGSKYTEDDIS